MGFTEQVGEIEGMANPQPTQSACGRIGILARCPARTPWMPAPGRPDRLASRLPVGDIEWTDKLEDCDIDREEPDELNEATAIDGPWISRIL